MPQVRMSESEIERMARHLANAQRWDDDGIWEPEETGEVDEDGDPIVDYVLVGSDPLSHWEQMLFTSSGVQYNGW